MTKIDDSYRKKLETLIFLMVFGLKNGNNVVIPQHLCNMVRAFISKKKGKRQNNEPSQENSINAVQLFNKTH